MSDKPDLAALLGSRICHDLISPIGAIGNGVELLMMAGPDQGPEIALIAESVGHANARIRFFRVAFGAATPDQRMARTEVAAILSDLTRSGRLAIDWQGPADTARREVKLAFLLIQCLESAMPYGGHIAIRRDGTGVSLTGEAAKLRVTPPLWAHLADPSRPVNVVASDVHFALATEESQRQARPLSVTLADAAIRLVF